MHFSKPDHFSFKNIKEHYLLSYKCIYNSDSCPLLHLPAILRHNLFSRMKLKIQNMRVFIFLFHFCQTLLLYRKYVRTSIRQEEIIRTVLTRRRMFIHVAKAKRLILLCHGTYCLLKKKMS